MIVSKNFIIALKLNSEPAYRISQLAGVNPSVLSKLVNGIENPKPFDPRIVKVGKVLGLSAENCFEDIE